MMREGSDYNQILQSQHEVYKISRYSSTQINVVVSVVETMKWNLYLGYIESIIISEISIQI